MTPECLEATRPRNLMQYVAYAEESIEATVLYCERMWVTATAPPEAFRLGIDYRDMLGFEGDDN